MKKPKTQNQIWIDRINKLTDIDVVDQFQNPSVFHLELKEIIESFSNGAAKIIELGSETGTTSFILNNSFDKILLDLNHRALMLSRFSFAKLGKKAAFIVGDMFKLPFKNERFDIIFNSGVLEHFKRRERIAALHEYSKILKPDGKMILAFPNHFCLPYKLVYIYLRARGKWRFPTEYTIYNMKKEIRRSNLVLHKRQIIAKELVFSHWINIIKKLKPLFILLDKIFNFPGYLTVLIINKK